MPYSKVSKQINAMVEIAQEISKATGELIYDLDVIFAEAGHQRVQLVPSDGESKWTWAQSQEGGNPFTLHGWTEPSMVIYNLVFTKTGDFAPERLLDWNGYTPPTKSEVAKYTSFLKRIKNEVKKKLDELQEQK